MEFHDSNYSGIKMKDDAIANASEHLVKSDESLGWIPSEVLMIHHSECKILQTMLIIKLNII